MVDHSALVHVFRDYARTIAHRYKIGDVLYRIADQVVEVLGVDGAGVSIVDRHDSLMFVSATDEDVVRVEEKQIEYQEGPCHDAHRSGEVALARDLTTEERWPSYREAALAIGVRAVAGIPMAVDDRKVGALNLYNRTTRDWTAAELDIARVLADMATGYILNAITLDESERMTLQLQHALDSRIIIEQAKGILAERHGVSTSAAFQRLREHARSTRTRVHLVAEGVLDGSLQL